MSTLKCDKCHLLALAVTFCALFFVASAKQNATTQTGNDADKKSMEKAVKPLYDMTNSFLELVQPESRGSFIEEYDLDSVAGFADLLQDDFKSFTKHYSGYFACLLVGLLFVVFMPLFGLILCCCRCCCGNCGAHPGEPGKSDKCKRISCGILLAIFATIMLVSIIFGFFTNDLLRKQTSKTDRDAFLPQIKLSLHGLEDFTKRLITDIDTIPEEVDYQMDSLLDIIKQIPDDVKKKVGEVSKAEEVITTAETLATSVTTINSSLHNIDLFTQDLVTRGEALNQALIDLTKALDTTLSNVACKGCDAVETSQINTLTNYTQVDAVTDQLNNVTEIVDANITGLVDKGKKEFDDIANKVEDQVQEEIDKADVLVQDLIKAIEEETSGVKQDLEEIKFGEYQDAILAREDDVEEYGDYRFYGGIALGCIMLLVVLFYCLGLCFGIVGDEPDDGAPCCNRGVGANLLMAGVAFSFFFSWLVMLITIALFMSGGLVHTEICRPLEDLTNSSMQNAINNFMENTINLKERTGFDVDLIHVLRTCKEDGTLYVALNLEEQFNITQRIVEKNKDIEKEIAALKEQDVDLSDVELLNDETLQQLTTLRDTDLDKIDFNSFDMQLENDFVSVDLEGLAEDLRDLAKLQTDPGIKDDLNRHANTTIAIQRDNVEPMTVTEADLKNNLDTLRNELEGNDAAKSFSEKVGHLIDEFKAADERIKSEGENLVQQAIDDVSESLTTETKRVTNNLVSMVENDKGKCYEMYDHLNTAVDATCVNLLYPYNGFWFSYGWGLFFIIPSLIVALYLATLYRKVLDYPSHKGFEEPNYDAYAAYPGDNIPLEDMQGRKAQRTPYQGQPNPAYVRDEQPPRGHHGQDNPRRAAREEIRGTDYDYGGRNGLPRQNQQRNGGNDQYQNRYYPQSSSAPQNPPHYYNHRGKYY